MVLISDGPNYFRIQVKMVEAQGEGHKVENKWQDSFVDYVIYFARNSIWGYMAKAFAENHRPLNHPEHKRFERTNRSDFLKTFHMIG